MTNTNLVLIDNYFKGQLSAPETIHFEQKILADQSFAEDVVFYCGTMELAKEKVNQEKTERFRQLYKGETPVRSLRKWWPYAAAAAVVAGIIFLALSYFRTSSLIDEKIDRHIAENLAVISVQMGSAADSLELARQWYNEGKLAETGQVLDRWLLTGNQREGVHHLAGLVALRLGDYDKAITHFTTLEKMPLFANPGKFYHALALLKRNVDQDRETAKMLLQQVVRENLEGKEFAADLLDSL